MAVRSIWLQIQRSTEGDFTHASSSGFDSGASLNRGSSSNEDGTLGVAKKESSAADDPPQPKFEKVDPVIAII